MSFVHLTAVAGAVFGSQAADVSASAGLGWSNLLLGEAFSIVSPTALALIFLGLAMVGPKREAEDAEIRFVPPCNRTAKAARRAQAPAPAAPAVEDAP